MFTAFLFYILFESFAAGVCVKNAAIYADAEFEIVAVENAFEVLRRPVCEPLLRFID